MKWDNAKLIFRAVVTPYPKYIPSHPKNVTKTMQDEIGNKQISKLEIFYINFSIHRSTITHSKTVINSIRHKLIFIVAIFSWNRLNIIIRGRKQRRAEPEQ